MSNPHNTALAHPIPFFTTERQAEALGRELDAAMGRALRSNHFILGQEGAALEREFAAFCNAGQAVGVANGTDAITIALMALGIGAGDEVITAPNSSPFTALGIARSGARVVFADVDLASYTLDVEAVRCAITPRTRAIVPVHLYGRMANMGELMALARAHTLRVVEDACQAHGAALAGQYAGAMGDAGAFSFYPTKNLGALGDAGMIVTNDPALAERMRRIRNGGRENRDHHAELGLNSRLDELQAAILRVKLAYVQAWNARRRELAGRYRRNLAGCALCLPTNTENAEHVNHLFVVRHPRREDLRNWLAQHGVGSHVHYPIPIHLHRAFAGLGYHAGQFPQAEQACREVLSLPIFPELREDEVDAICEVILAWQAH